MQELHELCRAAVQEGSCLICVTAHTPNPHTTRETGQIRLAVIDDTQQSTVQPLVEQATRSDATVYSDEAGSFAQIGRMGRVHLTVNHGRHEWARDADDDGLREVHDNTVEGIWAGLRNFLRALTQV